LNCHALLAQSTLHRRIRQPDDDYDGPTPAAIDLHLDREGFNTIDLRLRRKWPDYGGQGGGQNTGKHGRIVLKRWRKCNAVYAGGFGNYYWSTLLVDCLCS
jgi:hypothetical protein